MVVSAARATTLANSVFPDPGGPSARTGFCICAAKYMTFNVTGSATYLAASSLSDSSSIEANTYLRSLKPHVRAESLQSFRLILCPGAQRNYAPTRKPFELSHQRRSRRLL